MPSVAPPDAVLRLRQHIARFVALTDEEWNLLVPHLQVVAIKKHGLFAQEGRVADDAAFVLEGMFRQFYTKDFEHHLMTQ